FLVMGGWLLYYGFKEKPFESLAGMSTVLAGLIVYFFIQREKGISLMSRRPILFSIVSAVTLAAFVSLFIVACPANSGKKVDNGIKPVDRKYNDYARFIAGLPQLEGSALIPFEKSSIWSNFSSNFSKSWADIDENRLKKMRAWAATELADVNKEKHDIFYPFSGADFLHVFTFFPNGKRYVFIALEPVGETRDFATMNEGATATYLNSVDEALKDIKKRSYFITLNMIADLRKNKADGTLPLLCLMLVRTGNQIIDIQYVDTDGTGGLKAVTNAGKKKSVKIDFVSQDDPSEIKTLVYFSANLCDDKYDSMPSLRDNPGLVKYLDTLNGAIGYTKSASYLMHYGTFSQIRETFLAKSKLILQDDTGVPYRYFAKPKWDITLYGKYAKPVKDFSNVEQPDLKKAYENPTVKDLPFSLGYHWYTGMQNWLIARKK
ncbi:MAG: hypothetical protein JNM63_07925, partial [Spirochaetia bacterium]|nr:hypothetical protein [Spirochaetia bacterium]